MTAIMSDRDLHKLFEDIGFIKAKVEKIDGIDSRLLSVEKKISRIWGWAGGAGAVFGLTFALMKDWIKSKLGNGQ